MPEINITMKVRAAFIEESHREAIVETVRQSAQAVMTNIIMLTPSNNRIIPSVTVAVEQRGEDKRVYDTAKEMVNALPADYEDPFA